MKQTKAEILNNICYTELVYSRINKKLKSNLSNVEIENFIFEVIKNAHVDNFIKTGKNFYVSNLSKNIRITVNSNTYRIITVDKIQN
ncbi:DUF3781 domain-containing protein [Tenacibaculum sp. UWU-22]|uniref:DUF3781 domain-containing protein n=1 Tax=Tenacibaculum sp. UWU-22 TaxID=3234187 RepID=UPI0034DB5CA7